MGLLKNKILIIIGVVLLLGGCTWLFIWFSKSKAPVSPAVNAIPVNTFCVIESQQARDTWKKLAQGNLLWEDLGVTATVGSINRSGHLLDSLLNSSPEAAELIAGNPGWLSLHCTGNDQLNWLFAVSLPRVNDESTVRDFISKVSGGKKAQEEDHKNITIYRSGNYSYAFRQGTLILSDNNSLVGASLDQLEKGLSLLKDKSFAAVLATAGGKADANVYINYAQLPLFLKRSGSEDAAEHIEALSRFAGWSEADLTVKPNSAMFNGFTQASDTAGDFLALFRKQQPQRVQVTSILPGNTTSMLFFGIGSFPAYYDSYQDYLEKHGLGAERSSSIMGINTQYRINIDSLMTGWIGNEMAYVTTNGAGSQDDRCYAVFASNNIAQAREQLGRLKYITDFIDRQAQSGADMRPDTSYFNGYPIRRIGILHLVPIMFGSTYDRLVNTYYTIIGRYVVFANSDAALRTFIISYENGKTMAADRFYVDFATNLSDETNVYLYTAVNRSKDFYKSFANESVGAQLENQSELLRKIEGFGVQFSANNNLFYTNAFVRHNNPETKQEIASLWEAALDTTFSGKPELVLNHNSKTLDVFVQDDANGIYLFSNTGKLWWKRKLPEKIIGRVQQVDALKNGKLQLVFCTSSSLYVIDRNGKDLDKFPMRLPAACTNGVQVFDYENNRDYRLLIGCADKEVYNYTIKGAKVEGWKFDAMQDITLAPIQRCQVSGKDYIVVADRTGRLYIVDRQGKTRLQLKQRLSAPLSEFILEPGKDFERTRIVSSDSLGNVIRINLNDVPENIHLTDFGTRPAFDYRDINNDGVREYIMLDTARLTVFSQDKQPVMNYVFEKAASGHPLVFAFPQNDVRIGAVTRASGEIHLVNASGVETQGFPLFGETAFSIGDLNNDGNLMLVCGGKRKYIYAYPVK